MTLDAGFAAALRPEIILDGIPVPRVRIDPQPGPGAVAGLADVPVPVAGLARLEVAACFRGMIG